MPDDKIDWLKIAEEHWKPVPGYEDIYWVSDQGRVCSRPRPCTRGGVLKNFQSAGYAAIKLHRSGKSPKTVRVHKLVSEAFLGPCPAGQQVRHRDRDRMNPAVNNLLYGTSAENNQDLVRHGVHANANKTHCPQNHEYTVDNTYYLPSGSRSCRRCHTKRSTEWSRKNRAAKKKENLS